MSCESSVFFIIENFIENSLVYVLGFLTGAIVMRIYEDYRRKMTVLDIITIMSNILEDMVFNTNNGQLDFLKKLRNELYIVFNYIKYNFLSQSSSTPYPIYQVPDNDVQPNNDAPPDNVVPDHTCDDNEPVLQPLFADVVPGVSTASVDDNYIPVNQ